MRLSMRAINRTAFVAVAFTVAAAATARAVVDSDFSRYQVILDREPFGKPPPVPVVRPAPGPVVPPAPLTPPFVRDLKMCAVTESDGKLRVGLIDIKSKPEKTYLLYVGESTGDGIELVEADYEEEKALLRRGEEEHWIYMSGAAESVGGAPTPAGAAVAAPRAAIISASRPAGDSYAARMRARREALVARQRAAVQPKLSGEELKEHLQKYQMDLIRKGMPPLPMALTKEMDDQLVSEGVLPSLQQ